MCVFRDHLFLLQFTYKNKTDRFDDQIVSALQCRHYGEVRLPTILMKKYADFTQRVSMLRCSREICGPSTDSTPMPCLPLPSNTIISQLTSYFGCHCIKTSVLSILLHIRFGINTEITDRQLLINLYCCSKIIAMRRN